MDRDELVNRFTYHPPVGPGRAALHEDLRTMFGQVAATLNELVPDGREKALAMTNLEQAMFWSNAAVARQG